MKTQMKTIVVLDPGTEYDVINKYMSDPGWKQTADGTISVRFECDSPVIDMGAVYMPSVRKENE